mgnify:CR=1 FL=1|jgi:two-component system, NtrC family, sensor kinase
MVKGDPQAVTQVLINLLSNAGDASDLGAEILVTASQQEQQIEIEVTDHGMGISEQDIDTVFDPFVTTKVAGQGTGLGLSIVHRIIEEHGGKITLHSKLNAGTTAHISLPQQATLITNPIHSEQAHEPRTPG